EDGIRDFHVTGVQTCALPIRNISVAYRSSVACILVENVVNFYFESQFILPEIIGKTGIPQKEILFETICDIGIIRITEIVPEYEIFGPIIGRSQFECVDDVG